MTTPQLPHQLPPHEAECLARRAMPRPAGGVGPADVDRALIDIFAEPHYGRDTIDPEAAQRAGAADEALMPFFDPDDAPMSPLQRLSVGGFVLGLVLLGFGLMAWGRAEWQAGLSLVCGYFLLSLLCGLLLLLDAILYRLRARP